MRLGFNAELANQYKSPSQRIRRLTEEWVRQQVYCPSCGNTSIDKYPDNKPVADFFCQHCREDYELKSKKDSFGNKIVDGAYKTMMERLTGSGNPNFFLLNYDLLKLQVLNFFVVPKHFFVPEIIEKRKPLSATADRAGWVGCNILIRNIPQAGRIFFIKNGKVEMPEDVLSLWQKTLFLRNKSNELKGWTLEVMRCIDQIGMRDFSLDEVYSYEADLRFKYPDNKHIKDKIRQQLQYLRDKGYLEFRGSGKYSLSR